MRHSRLPSKMGPCINFDIVSGSKFCGICGHTGGSHRFTAKNLPMKGGWCIVRTHGNDEVVKGPMIEADAMLVARRMNKEALSADILR